MNTPHTLLRHPSSPPSPVASISASVQIEPHDLVIQYLVRGHLDAVRWPARSEGGPADALWQHTCLEAFIAPEGSSAYREFNFSPSGQWAAYRFAGERQRDSTLAPDMPAPLMQLAITPALFTLDVHLSQAALPSPSRHFQLALCAVIEEHDGRLSYWALQHPQARPDFHHPAGRSLRLALPAN